MRVGPGLGTIQPSQADYFQTVKGGGHGDYRLIALAPASVQEMADFVGLAFELAFKYRNPAIILADGVIGQMMEKVVLPPFRPRWTEEEIRQWIGCDALIYQDLEAMKQAIAQVNPAIAGFEASCFDAQYITGDTSDEPRTHCQQPVSADGEDDGEGSSRLSLPNAQH